MANNLLQRKVLAKVKNKFKEILKEERGAVTVLVFITILTFVVILLGAYLTVTTMRKSRVRK